MYNDPQMNFGFAEEQNRNLDRVRSRIGRAIIAFLSSRTSFRADELRQYVASQAGVALAPGSSDRVLRDLRQSGLINYRVLSRRQSLYEVLPAASAPAP